MIPAGVQGTKRGRFCTSTPDVVGMEAVHVLARVHEVEHELGIDLRGQGELHEDAVDVRPEVVLPHDRRDLGGRRRDGQTPRLVVHPELLAGAGLART